MENGLQQLDLFGFPIETGQPKKKEKAAKPVPAPKAIAEPGQESVTLTAIEEEKIIAPVDIPSQPVISKKNNATKPAAGKRGRKSFKEMDNEADLIDVPDDEVLKQKLYYSISEVAGWFKVNTSLLRYWENEFDILQPRKTRKGDRLFRVEDIKNLQLIYFLLRQRKFSIDGAKNYLKNNKQEADTQARLVESLTKFKSFLLELKANLHA
jgi:DNA-binding transcriptional MerR regulator